MIALMAVLFPAPFAPEKRDDLALLGHEVHAVQHFNLAIGGMQIFNGGGASAPPPVSWLKIGAYHLRLVCAAAGVPVKT